MNEEPDTVLHLFDKETNANIEYDLLQTKLDSIMTSGKYILAYYNKENEPKFFRGDKLLIGDITYLQKVINTRTDQVI